MAEKDFSVNINVGLNTSDAEKQLEGFEKKVTNFSKELKGLLSGGGDLKFAVGGYGTSETMSTGYAEALKKSIKKNMAVNKDWEDSFDSLDDAVEASFEGIIETLQSAEAEMKREMNNIAQRYAKMLGVDFVANIAESLGEQDFALPTAKMSEAERKQATQDFISAGDKVIYSPAAFISAIESLAQKIPFAEFPAQRIPVKGAGVDKISFRDAASYGKEMNLGGAFEAKIPEISEEIKDSIFDLMDRATEQGNSTAIGDFLRQKVEDLLTEIFNKGYKAREATFKGAGGSEGEDSVENLIRYADASARAAIAKAEEEFGLAAGTFAKSVKLISNKLTEEDTTNSEIARKLQKMDRDAGGTGEGKFIGDISGRDPSSPATLLKNLYGDYNDLGTGTLMATPDPRDVPDLMAQIFQNPAIIASGKDGVKGLMEDLGKFVTPVADTGFDAAAYKAGLQKVKEEVEASGQKFLMAFDTEFNQKLPQQITEASIAIKDASGKFQEVVGFIQAPPSSQYGAMAQGSRGSGGVAAGSYNELAERAAALGLKGEIGAKDFEANFKQFYAKMNKLSGVLQIAAELDIPVVGSNIQGADYDKLFKSIKFINETIDELGVELPKLQYPIQQTLLDTRDIVDKAAKAKSPTGIALTSESMPGLKGANVENILRNLVTQFPDALGANLQRIELKPGGGFKIDGLDAHFARADNQAVLIITEAMSKFEDLVAFMQTKIASDYQPKKVAEKQLAVAAQAAGGSGGLDARRTGGGEEDPAKKRFLTEKEQLPLLKDLTKLEQKQVLLGLDRLAETIEYKKLLETERTIKQNILVLEEKLRVASTREEKRDALKALIAEKRAYENLVAAGKKLEIQKRDEIKLSIRGKDVKDKDLQTTSKQIDEMNRLRSTTGGVGREIVGQLKEQAAATKAVEAQSKSLINTWVTGRYALYDVGNAYAGVARQLWMASRQIFNITQAYRSYETAFTSVERAIEPLAATISGTREEAQSLKEAFMSLSEQIPVSFEDISRIATLGAQMGVTASGIVDFTQVVAEFSAVTGVSADTVAQKFGRIAELANVDYSQFANLGSSILYAGINAVATEPEIMTLSESIAAVSAQAGMLPQEIVGMATALASTGIQAEQARGVFTRVFADIDRAVSRGGSELNAFASVAGMSAEDFAKAWGTEGASYDVFRALLGGLGATEDLTKAFDSLNIVETREINTLTRLAENLNVVDQAASDAAGSFESGTFLSDSFGKTVDNLDAKITMFNNNLKSLTEELSSTMAGGLIVVIDFANGFLQILKEIAKNPLAAWLTTASLGITALGAVVTFGVSAMAKLVAQIYAFRVAAINTANDSTAVTGMSSMIKQLTGFSSSLIEMRDQLGAPAPETRGIITPTTFKMFDSLEKRKKKLIQQDNIYLATLKGRGTAAVTAARKEADSVNQIIKARVNEIAVIETQEGLSARERASKIAAIGGTRIYVETINGKTRALAANEVATLRKIAASNAATVAERKEITAILANIQAINTQTRVASQAGAGVLGLGTRMLGLATGLGTALGVLSLAYTVFEGVRAGIESTKIDLLESGGGLASLRDAIKQDTVEYEKLSKAQDEAAERFTTVSVKTRNYSTEANKTAEAIRGITGVSEEFVQANKTVTEGIKNTTLALGDNTRVWFANAIMQDENFKAALNKYPDLLDQLKSQGFDVGEVLSNIFESAKTGTGDPLAEINQRYNQLYDQILILNHEDARGNLKKIKDLQKQIGVLDLIKTALTSVSEALGQAINEDEVFNAISEALGITSDAADETADSIDNLGDSIRTVLDYASDLASILSRVVELEFGKQMSRDAITTGWRDLRKSVDDAREAIKEANDEIKGLTADRDILQYQLSVAERYGDEVRAAKIRAELAKINEQVANSEKDLAKAKADSSTALTGDSDAAIRNRAELLKMVGTYQSHIEMLAKLGMNRSELTSSAETLRRQFLAEAKALGFSGKQLEDYADLFDNFADVAADAPRDVDIEVIPALSAAEQAIKEFTDKKRSATVDVKTDLDPKEDPTKKVTTAIDDWLKGKPKVKVPFYLRPPIDFSKPANDALSNWLKGVNPKVPFYLQNPKDFSKSADDALSNWLKGVNPKVPFYLRPPIDFSKPANDALSNWLKGVNPKVPFYLQKPKDFSKSADKDIYDWLNMPRTLKNPQIKGVETSGAKSAIDAFIRDSNKLAVSIKMQLDKNATLRGMAQSVGDLARMFASTSPLKFFWDGIRAAINAIPGFASGGYVNGAGSGRSDSIPARLSNGEFVMQASAVKTYGVDFFNALNQQRMGFSPAAPMMSGGQQSGPTMVFLSPEDRQLLRQFGDRPVNLYADATKIAEVTNAGNTKMSRRGSR